MVVVVVVGKHGIVFSVIFEVGTVLRFAAILQFDATGTLLYTSHAPHGTGEVDFS